MQSAVVFDIQKFSIHDGPGIRTNVFVKGCPLRCIWCHNPESWNTSPEMLFSAEKCTACGMCARICSNGCHEFADGGHGFLRENCVACGKCVEHCRGDALELCGKVCTAEECLEIVMMDKVFYDNSGGGMTVSGGEPMMHFDFTQELLRLAKEEGLHNCIETCGFAPWNCFEQLLPFVDIFLYDIKAVKSEKHREYTGQDNALILENLRRLDQAGAKVYLRCPLVPGLNDGGDDLLAIANLANSLENVEEIDIEPYHPLGVSKAARLGMTEFFSADFVAESIWRKWVETISSVTEISVKKI